MKTGDDGKSLGENMLDKMVEDICKAYEIWREESRLGIPRNDLAVKVQVLYNKLEDHVKDKGYDKEFEEMPIHIAFARVHDASIDTSTRIKFRAAKAIQEIVNGGDTLEIYQGLIFLRQRKALLESFGTKFDGRFLGKRRAMRPLLKKCHVCNKYQFEGSWREGMPKGKFEVISSLCPPCKEDKERSKSNVD
jgi:hypothetical protein